MAKTVNRYPSISDVNYKKLNTNYFLHSQFKGKQDNKNDALTDPNTFADCKNIYIDTDENLVSRAPIKLVSDKYYLVDEFNVNGYNCKVYSYYCDKNDSNMTPLDYFDTNLTELKLISIVLIDKCPQIIYTETNIINSLYIHQLKLDIKITSIKNYLIVWLGGIASFVFDTIANTLSDIKDYIYKPITKLIINGLEKEQESINNLSDIYIKRYLYSKDSSVNFTELADKNVTVSISQEGAENKLYSLAVNEYSNYLLLYKSVSTNKSTIIDIVKTARGNIILTSYENTVRVSYDGISFKTLPSLKGAYSDIYYLTKDGFDVIGFTTEGIWHCKLFSTDVSETQIEFELKWELLQSLKIQADMGVGRQFRYVIAGYFENIDNFGVMYSSNLNSDNKLQLKEYVKCTYQQNGTKTYTHDIIVSSTYITPNDRDYRPFYFIQFDHTPAFFANNSITNNYLLGVRLSSYKIGSTIYARDGAITSGGVVNISDAVGVIGPDIYNEACNIVFNHVTENSSSYTSFTVTTVKLEYAENNFSYIWTQNVYNKTIRPTLSDWQREKLDYDDNTPILIPRKSYFKVPAVLKDNMTIITAKGITILAYNGNIVTQSFYPFPEITENLMPIDLTADTLFVIDEDGNLYTNELKDGTIFYLDIEEGSGYNLLIPDYDTVIDKTYYAYNNFVIPNEDKYDLDKQKENIDKFLLYFPLNNKQTFLSLITNLHRISDTIIGIFTGTDIWYISSTTESGKTLYYAAVKTKLPVGLRNGDDIVTMLNGQSVLFPTIRGIAVLQPQDFVATTDMQLQYLTDNIQSTYEKFFEDKNTVELLNDNSPHLEELQLGIKIRVYKYWIIIYKYMSTQCLWFDTRNNSWWPIEVKYPIQDIICNDRIKFICRISTLSSTKIYDNDAYFAPLEGCEFLYCSKEMNVEYTNELPDILLNEMSYDDTLVGFYNNRTYYPATNNNIEKISNVIYKTGIPKKDINWYFVSQKLNFGQPVNYKKVLAMYMTNKGDESVSIELLIKAYRDSYHPEKTLVMQERINDIRTFVKRMNVMHVTDFQYEIKQDKTADIQKQFRLNSLSIKYEIKEVIR